MKSLIVSILILAAIVLGLYFWKGRIRNTLQHYDSDLLISNNLKSMELDTTSFVKNGDIPPKYTCDGDNINPKLSINGVPENAKSLVLIMNDPDASLGTWTHWTVWNIKPDTKEINENSVPEGSIQGMISAGTVGYSGPCPPSGMHRYFFKIYALDSKLDLNENTRVDELSKTIEKHIIDRAELLGKYKRK